PRRQRGAAQRGPRRRGQALRQLLRRPTDDQDRLAHDSSQAAPRGRTPVLGSFSRLQEPAGGRGRASSSPLPPAGGRGRASSSPLPPAGGRGRAAGAGEGLGIAVE